MIKNGINGKFYSSFKSLITNMQSCVRLNGILSDWFPTISGVRQGDTNSSTVFALYINDFIKGINSLDKGIKYGNNQLSCLVYADDIILLSESENDMQTMLDFTNDWCNNWRLRINHSKSNCMHFRNKGKSRRKYLFKVKGYVLEYTDTYKYLGIFIMHFSYTADTLAKAGSRALGSVIQKIHSKKDIGFKTYKKLYESCVIPVIDYCSSSWGFKEYKKSESIQNRCFRYLLGVHKFTPLLCISGDIGVISCRHRHWVNMLRLWNRILKMADNRLPKTIFNYDYNCIQKS